MTEQLRHTVETLFYKACRSSAAAHAAERKAAVTGAEPSPVTPGCLPQGLVQLYPWEPLEAGDLGSFVTVQTFPDQGGTQLSHSLFRS